jgi:hypothetical protein
MILVFTVHKSVNNSHLRAVPVEECDCTYRTCLRAIFQKGEFPAGSLAEYFLKSARISVSNSEQARKKSEN